MNQVLDLSYVGGVEAFNLISYTQFRVNILLSPIFSLVPYYIIASLDSLYDFPDQKKTVMQVRVSMMTFVVILLQVGQYTRQLELSTIVIQKHMLEQQ